MSITQKRFQCAIILKYMEYAKFTLMEQLTEISNVSKDTRRLQLKR